MPDPSPMLHMLCGKIAAGKSTLAARLAEHPRTILVAEDDWLSVLFREEIRTLADHLRCAARLRAVMAPHVAALLNAGVSVVLDFPANTVGQRAWMRGILDRTGAAHRLHLLEVPEAVCLARLRDRNRKGDPPFAVTDARFHQVAAHFSAPSPDEGFDVASHAADSQNPLQTPKGVPR